jgi:hypothetical protein
VDVQIPEELFDRLEITSRKPLAWPHDMFSSPAQTGFTYGGFLDRIDSERSFPIRANSSDGIESYIAEKD